VVSRYERENKRKGKYLLEGEGTLIDLLESFGRFRVTPEVLLAPNKDDGLVLEKAHHFRNPPHYQYL
jgi:hypothetical protein